MKKLLPIILVGVAVVIAVIFFVTKGNKKTANVEEEAPVSILPEALWPAVSLTPTEKAGVKGSMGHWLNLKVEKINVPDAKSMDYLLVYTTSDGGQQGVPGKVTLAGDIDRPLLLGSESSGKFRYDAGVSTGTITITFRDSAGKSIGKISSEFHLQSDVTELTSTDGQFKYTLDKMAKGVYFVTMKTFLEPKATPVVWQNGYGVFASDGKPHSGK